MKRLSYLCGQVRAIRQGFCRAAASGRAGAKTRSAGGRLRAFLRSGSEGQSLAEFAIALPMLLMVLTFMFSMTMAMITYEQLINAVNVASTQILYNALVVSGGDPCASIQTMIDSTLPSSFDRSKLTFTVTIQNSSGQTVTYGPTTGAGFSCTAARAMSPWPWLPVEPLATTTIRSRSPAT